MDTGIAVRIHSDRSCPVTVLVPALSFSGGSMLSSTHAGVNTDLASCNVHTGQPDGTRVGRKGRDQHGAEHDFEESSRAKCEAER